MAPLLVEWTFHARHLSVALKQMRDAKMEPNGRHGRLLFVWLADSLDFLA